MTWPESGGGGGGGGAGSGRVRNAVTAPRRCNTLPDHDDLPAPVGRDGNCCLTSFVDQPDGQLSDECIRRRIGCVGP